MCVFRPSKPKKGLLCCVMFARSCLKIYQFFSKMMATKFMVWLVGAAHGFIRYFCSHNYVLILVIAEVFKKNSSELFLKGNKQRTTGQDT